MLYDNRFLRDALEDKSNIKIVIYISRISCTHVTFGAEFVVVAVTLSVDSKVSFDFCSATLRRLATIWSTF